MLPVRTILHPTDFSAPSRYAFRVACALARDYKARLVVLHVEPPPTVVAVEGFVAVPPEGAEEELREKLENIKAPDVEMEHRLIEGYPASVILEVAAEVGADVIVMGTHGRTGLGRLLMGSVAEEVLRKAACPVLTIRTPVPVTSPALADVAKVEETPVPASRL